jgi:hypothetical protein
MVKNKYTSKCWGDAEKLEPLCTAGWNIKWYRCFRKQFGGSLKCQTELLYDLAILLLCIYPKEFKAGIQILVYQ